MALGKLWNAFFGKRSETETTATADVVAESVAATNTSAERPILKTKRKALVGKAKKTAQAPALVIAAVDEAPEVAVKRIPHPKKNAWSKLVVGRQITSILDTNLGDASRAVELLEAIVCDAVSTPKYVAIDDFDLTSGGTTVLQFHQRVRSVGGKAVPIPGAIDEGLRHLSRTLGTVDLVLIDDAKPQLQTEETSRLLARVTHPATLLLRRDARNKWTVIESGVIAASTTRQADKPRTKLSQAA